ncbi:MAG: type II toxin-antitoxin system HicA family toxin [Rubrobacteraceae bacterium]
MPLGTQRRYGGCPRSQPGTDPDGVRRQGCRSRTSHSVKRGALLKHLKLHGCEFLREGSRHTMYVNRDAGRSSAVPRHSEITNNMARKICRDLGIPPV